jgi:hypothetical protein
MGVHFTNHSPQLGVHVVVGFIVNADQDVFDGLGHDGAFPMEPNWHDPIWVGLGEIWAPGREQKRLHGGFCMMACVPSGLPGSFVARAFGLAPVIIRHV